MGMERELCGNHVFRQAEYIVFHDESIPNKRWLLIGLSFVDAGIACHVRQVLHQAREKEGYYGEIHFCKLPGSFGGDFGGKARVARRWMKVYQNGLVDMAFFSCLAVDRHSRAYDHRRFTRDFHAYNRFTAMALKAGIAWHLRPLNLDALTIHFVSDAKDRVSRPGHEMVDNFEAYLPYRAELDSFLAQAGGRSYPQVTMRLELCDSSKEDLLQLTDLLLGAT